MAELFLAEGSERLKLVVLYSGEEDERLRRAAAGTLAVLTSLLPQICSRIPQVVSEALHAGVGGVGEGARVTGGRACAQRSGCGGVARPRFPAAPLLLPPHRRSTGWRSCRPCC